MVTNTLVNAFVMSAEDDNILHHREVIGSMLSETLSIRRCENDLVIVSFFTQMGYAAVDRFYLHHHTRKASIGIVVNTTPLVESIVAQVMDMDFGESFLLGPCNNALVHEWLDHLGQNRYDIYTHILIVIKFCKLMTCE